MIELNPRGNLQAAMQLPRIFVSIPAFRDPECADTLFSLFSQAERPERVFVGVCQQQAWHELDGVLRYRWLCKRRRARDFSDQVRSLRLPASAARGPCFARQLIEQQLFAGEELVLGIDSHTLFARGWDSALASELERCADPRAILTTYPASYDRTTRRPESHGLSSFMRARGFLAPEGMLHSRSSHFASIPKQPTPNWAWAAGFNFSRSDVLERVPYLQGVPFAFFGEEAAMAARLWTHGFNFYIPTRPLLFTTFDRSYRPSFFEQTIPGRAELKRLADKRLLAMVGADGGGGQVGPLALGTERTLTAYEAHFGINFAEQTLTADAVLGVTASDKEQDLLAKFGTLQRYEQLLNAIYTEAKEAEPELTVFADTAVAS